MLPDANWFRVERSFLDRTAIGQSHARTFHFGMLTSQSLLSARFLSTPILFLAPGTNLHPSCIPYFTSDFPSQHASISNRIQFYFLVNIVSNTFPCPSHPLVTMSRNYQSTEYFESETASPDSEAAMRSRHGKRSRVTQACKPCRTAKMRCDGRVPTCSSCAGRSWSCIYPISQKVRGPGKRSVQTASKPAFLSVLA